MTVGLGSGVGVLTTGGSVAFVVSSSEGLQAVVNNRAKTIKINIILFKGSSSFY